jgi:hypothetical protein
VKPITIGRGFTMDTGKPRNKNVDTDRREFKPPLDATDLIVFVLSTGPFWGALPLLLGLLGAWYFGRLTTYY